MNFQNGERIEQLEDQKYEGRVTARYVFKDGQVVNQEQLENVEPPRASSTFASVEEELRSIARDGASVVVGKPAETTFSGLESGAEIK